MITKEKKIYETVGELEEAIRNDDLMVGDEFLTEDIDGAAAFKIAHIGKKKIWLVRKYILKDLRPMKGGDYDLLEWLKGEYTDSLPEELTDIIDKDVTLPTEKQVFGKNEIGKKEKGKQFEYFKNCKHRIAVFNPEAEYSRWWWLATPYYDKERSVVSSAVFAVVNGNGVAHDYGASAAVGVRPAFAILRS